MGFLFILVILGLVFVAVIALAVSKIRGAKKEANGSEAKVKDDGAGPYRTKIDIIDVDGEIIKFEDDKPLPDPLDGFLSADDARERAREIEAAKIAAYRKERRKIWEKEVVPEINKAIEECKNEVSLHDLGNAKSKVMLELAKELGYEARDCLDYSFIKIKW